MYSQTRDGKVRFFETYIDPRTRQRKTVSVTMEKDTQFTRKKAQDRLSARIRDLKREPNKYTPTTLEELCEAYIAHQKARVKPQTVIGDENALKAVKEILGADTDISQIDARYITEKLDKTGETPTRKNYRLKHIKKLFRWAYQYDYIPNDITGKLVKYKDSEKSRREFKYMEQDELRAVLDAMRVEKYRIITEFLALTGLRIGEALALTADDIDTKNRTISINKTLSLVTYEIGQTKTDESNRTIYIQSELRPLMKKILPDCFRNIQYFAYNKYLKENTEKAIGRALSPHSLRHTHVSLLAASGVPLDVIAHRCGHSDSDVTRDIYLHITSKMKDRDAAILNKTKILKSTKKLPKTKKNPET